MAQTKLINGSSRTIKIGDPVKLHATKKNSLDLANLGDIIIGTSTQQVSPGSWCVVNLLNTVRWEDIIGKPAINVTPIDVSNFVTKETGKGLSSNDYTPAEKNKLAGLSDSGSGLTQSQILTRQL